MSKAFLPFIVLCLFATVSCQRDESPKAQTPGSSGSIEQLIPAHAQGSAQPGKSAESSKPAAPAEQEYARIQQDIKDSRQELTLDHWGRRYSAINRLKRRALDAETVLPADLKQEAIRLLVEFLSSEPDGSVKQNATETLEILRQGADGYFASLSKEGELEKRIDTLVANKLNSAYLVEHEDAQMMLYTIGKPALSRLAASLLDGSDFLTEEARAGGLQQGATPVSHWHHQLFAAGFCP